MDLKEAARNLGCTLAELLSTGVDYLEDLDADPYVFLCKDGDDAGRARKGEVLRALDRVAPRASKKVPNNAKKRAEKILKEIRKDPRPETKTWKRPKKP